MSEVSTAEFGLIELLVLLLCRPPRRVDQAAHDILILKGAAIIPALTELAAATGMGPTSARRIRRVIDDIRNRPDDGDSLTNGPLFKLLAKLLTGNDEELVKRAAEVAGGQSPTFAEWLINQAILARRNPALQVKFLRAVERVGAVPDAVSHIGLIDLSLSKNPAVKNAACAAMLRLRPTGRGGSQPSSPMGRRAPPVPMTVRIKGNP